MFALLRFSTYERLNEKALKVGKQLDIKYIGYNKYKTFLLPNKMCFSYLGMRILPYTKVSKNVCVRAQMIAHSFYMRGNVYNINTIRKFKSLFNFH